MKPKLIAVVAIGVVATLAVIIMTRPEPVGAGSLRVAVVSIVEIEPIVELREGFRDRFDASEVAQSRGVEYTEYNAQGDSAQVSQIADKIAVERPDLVYVLGTPTAQAIQNRSPELLLIQGAATDPVSSGLADSWQGSGRAYAATSDLPPVDIQLQLITTLTPEASRIGILYNPGEANSASVIERLRAARDADYPELDFVERPVANTAEVSQVVQLLAGEIDAIYLPPDNTVHAAIPVVGEFAGQFNVPFYATVESALDDGALAALALDFRRLGQQSADLAIQILGEGADPGGLPIQVSRLPTVYIDAEKAEALGVDLNAVSDWDNTEVR